MKIDCLVIGSGAGGAVTAVRLAEGGRSVLILEEGREHPASDYGRSPPEAMRLLYRRSGMTPILGRSPIGYVEGCCVGGSTEINSGFWHRTPREALDSWQVESGLAEASATDLEPHFCWAEDQIGVAPFNGPLPASTRLFMAGIAAMKWAGGEVPRIAPGCQSSNACASGCPTGAKAGASRSLLPRARALGATLLTNCRVIRLLHDGSRVTGVIARLTLEDGLTEQVTIQAEHVFVCAGAMQTPLLLRRSGFRNNIGDSLKLHPMIKVIAHFKEDVNAAASVLPLAQVSEFSPHISLGGAFFTPGHAAVVLSENGPEHLRLLDESRHLAAYYVAVRGSGVGKVRPSWFDRDSATIRYDLTREDVQHFGIGLASLASALLAGGADAIYPGVHAMPRICDREAAMELLDRPLPHGGLSPSTVHAFSTCPSGERREHCATDSFGKVYGTDNLYVNDASMLPGSPGVNPMGSIMALASRNAQRFVEASG